MNIYVLNTLETGIDIIDRLKKRLAIRGVIGLSKREPSNRISGYRHLKNYCESNQFAFCEVEDYALREARDRERLLALEIDLLILCGWQRLIPEWLIDHCAAGVIGAHGSAYGITRGRGRSPQNWALLMGEREFSVSIFKIDRGIDSGAVMATRPFPITPFDDIRSTYYKVSILVARMIIESVRGGGIQKERLQTQEGTPRYLPQRLPEDGEIDWSRKTAQVFNFVKALTKPYPGAFSLLGEGEKLTVWRAKPFQTGGGVGTRQSGEIAAVFSGGEFLVKTGDGHLLVEDYELEGKGDGSRLREGMVIPSADFSVQIRRIIDRHNKKYPGLKIAEEILNLTREAD